MKLGLFFNLFLLFDAPVVNAPGSAGSGGSGGSGEVGSHDTTTQDLALLNEENTEPAETEEEEEETLIPETEEEEEEETEEEEEEVDEEGKKTGKKVKKAKKEKETSDEEEEAELAAAAGDDEFKKSTYKAIKKAFPDFFKKFPALKNDLFRAQAFGAVFPSVEDAKEAAQVVQNYNQLRDVVLNGETDKFLGEVKDLGEKEFNTFTEKFLPALYSLSKDKYYDVVTPVLRASLQSIIKRGIAKGGKIGGTESNEGQNLINAAIVAHQDLFGNSDVEAENKPLSSSDTKKDPDREKFEKERNEFLQEKHKGVREHVEGNVKTTLINEIKAGLDPHNTLPAYVRDNLIRDIFLELDSSVSKNEAHMNVVNSLWKKELASGFTGQNKDKLVQAILSAARPLIPGIRQKLKTKALEGIARPKGKLLTKPKPAVVRSGNHPSTRSPNSNQGKGKSDLDIINED